MSPQEYLRRTGLTLAEVEDRSARIGRAKFLRVLEMNHLLLPLAPREPPSVRLERFGDAFPLLTSAWLNAPTLRAAIGCYVAYRPLLGESDWISLRENERTVRIEYVAEGPQRYAAGQAAGNFGALISIVRAYDQGVPTRFRAEFLGPLSSPFFGELVGGPVEYDRGVNALEFSRESLDAPFPRYNPAVAALLTRRLSAELAELQREGSLSLRVERTLRTTLAGQHGGGTAAEQVLERLCAELGMTRWTLRRRLAEEGTTFKALSAEVKLREARRLLEGTELSLGEVSGQLGFNSQSAFSRFFRQEAGEAPLRYRQARACGGG